MCVIGSEGGSVKYDEFNPSCFLVNRYLAVILLQKALRRWCHAQG